jgi:hypothetical protein
MGVSEQNLYSDVCQGFFQTLCINSEVSPESLTVTILLPLLKKVQLQLHERLSKSAKSTPPLNISHNNQLGSFFNSANVSLTLFDVLQ